MFNPVPKPEPRQKQCKPLKVKSRIKQTYDPIPNKVKDEVDEIEGSICQKCGRYFPERVPGLYHHVRKRSHRYEPMVRFWSLKDGVWDWQMVPVWFKFHSKENLVTLCPPPFGICHTLADQSELHVWEQRRDVRYKGEC